MSSDPTPGERFRARLTPRPAARRRRDNLVVVLVLIGIVVAAAGLLWLLRPSR